MESLLSKLRSLENKIYRKAWSEIDYHDLGTVRDTIKFIERLVAESDK